MASRQNSSKQNSNKRGTKTASGKTTARERQTSRNVPEQDSVISDEIILIGIFAIAILLFLCNFGIIGTAGNVISGIMFGIFGITAYIAPVFAVLAIMFGISNRGNVIAMRKLAASVILFVLAGSICEFINGSVKTLDTYQIGAIYAHSKEKAGGGILGGSIAYLLDYMLGFGAVLVIVVIGIICIVIITEKSFIGGVKKGSRRVYETAREDVDRRRERQLKRREEILTKNEEEEQEKILRMDKKVSGVMLDTSLERKEYKENSKVTKSKAAPMRDDIHEIVLEEEDEPAIDFDRIRIHTASQTDMTEITLQKTVEDNTKDAYLDAMPEPRTERARLKVEKAESPTKEDMAGITSDIHKSERVKPQKYIFPPLHLLNKPDNKQAGDSSRQLKETAARLQQTLLTCGVKVTITDISQGPSVTRYELQPEQGVKVSKIVGLADDIKLNLAATDIRIEAPIPGKAAIGIEVPNKENTAVSLRELLEKKEFKDFPSNIAFAVGKDLSGQVVVTDIAKMPHMLIAGATGSGKSVCINTLIMSILYKAHPDDVKLIMVDPKVVELNVYNGIPHLLIPVVTDPKKAAAALHWGVAEMTERYKKFADFNVRDLKGYNQKVEAMATSGAEDAPKKLPQIVIIVDELADLMMVAPGEVEESICRLAQLARACGIHLIIATQRPSVDVITGLIKANMPSRVAFSVSSGVDSRTILDMNGAEKLLGKGDMLFYPQGYSKPARVQGAFVSDKEVSDVVEFLKNQAIGNVYAEDIEEKIQSIGSGSGATGSGDSASERDAYFVDAGRFIIEKDKASIGMLQRVFKIGFNRAARIMDQLCDAGVVGEEEGTKPRKVLMSMDEFEQFIEDCV